MVYGRKSSLFNFIEEIIESDIKMENMVGGYKPDFHPNQNGYLHIGHAKSICLNFGLAQTYKERQISGLMIPIRRQKRQNILMLSWKISGGYFDWEDRLFMHLIISTAL